MKKLTQDQVIDLKKNDILTELVLLKLEELGQRLKHEFGKAFYICEKLGKNETTQEWSDAYSIYLKSEGFEKFSSYYHKILQSKANSDHVKTKGELAIAFSNFGYLSDEEAQEGENGIDTLELDKLAEFVVSAAYEWEEGDPAVKKFENILERIIRQSEAHYHLAIDKKPAKPVQQES